MQQLMIPAAFVRGGTSNGLAFLRKNLPENKDDWKQIFLAAMGSPDPHCRQLDGMGGGISSLSKILVVEKSKTPGVDIDYTFCQVSPRESWVAYSNICGNMASAAAPFAYDEGLISQQNGEVVVRVRSTNTGVLFDSRFYIDDGKSAVDGDFELPGVTGFHSPVRNEFLDPGGTNTGNLLPSNNIIDKLTRRDGSLIEASLVDATLAVAFIRGIDIGMTGKELPAQIDDDKNLMSELEHLRCQAGVLMGLSAKPQNVPAVVPKIAWVNPPQDSPSLSGEVYKSTESDFTARMISAGNCHRALPSTGSICTAVAARITGSVVHEIARPSKDKEDDVVITHPSGILAVSVDIKKAATGWHCSKAGVYRSQRRLFDGHVLVPASKISASVARELKTRIEAKRDNENDN